MEETTYTPIRTHSDYMFCPICGAILHPSDLVFLEMGNVVGCINCYNEYERR